MAGAASANVGRGIGGGDRRRWCSIIPTAIGSAFGPVLNLKSCSTKHSNAGLGRGAWLIAPQVARRFRALWALICKTLGDLVGTFRR